MQLFKRQARVMGCEDILHVWSRFVVFVFSAQNQWSIRCTRDCVFCLADGAMTLTLCPFLICNKLHWSVVETSFWDSLQWLWTLKMDPYLCDFISHHITSDQCQANTPHLSTSQDFGYALGFCFGLAGCILEWKWSRSSFEKRTWWRMTEVTRSSRIILSLKWARNFPSPRFTSPTKMVWPLTAAMYTTQNKLCHLPSWTKDSTVTWC